jgi:hypothetical protein
MYSFMATIAMELLLVIVLCYFIISGRAISCNVFNTKMYTEGNRMNLLFFRTHVTEGVFRKLSSIQKTLLFILL